jgi:two-component system CheB/CheR fusion protein
VANPNNQRFPIVGVGASAGGIESFRELLGAIPEKSGITYVLVQHLLPSHESMLPEILAQATSLPIQEITNDIPVEPGLIFVIPENKMVIIKDHILKLIPRKENEPNLPIDMFFSSLAASCGDMAVGVVLSGTASDGTNGLKAIKEQGGITFVENPLTAAWSGMPQSAIDAGVVDFVASPSEIPGKLHELRTAYHENDEREKDKLSSKDEEAFKQILSLIRINSGTDFTYYKKPTLVRRINRRIAITQNNTFSEYLVHLRENENEKNILQHDMLIQVTYFFRDQKVFSLLKKKFIPSIIKGKTGKGETIRIWVPGCSTGEEAYSLAIILHEVLGGFSEEGVFRRNNVQIFATDLSEPAIGKARNGIFSWSQLESISQERLTNYFNKINSEYQIKKPIRDAIVFAVHNFLKDPPFAKIDFISCRNVFIYMGPYLQKKALGTFHYALKEYGILLLGKAETVSAAAELFQPASKQERIYTRKPGIGRYVPSEVKRKAKQTTPKVRDMDNRPGQPDFRKSADAILLSHYTPVSVVVDQHFEVVHIKGSISPFLELPPGLPSHNLLKMAREGLGFELRNAIHKAKSTQHPVTKEDIPVRTNDEPIMVSIEVIPLTNTVESYFLILFQKKTRAISFFRAIKKTIKKTWIRSLKSELQQRNLALERELAQAREDMRGISEEQEISNEELQSANEELLSSNEEMQSLNEELETSKEELQSTNEELVIVNHELLERQNQLQDSLDYSRAIIDTLREPFLVLDKHLHVQTANAAFLKKFEARAPEIEGKHLFEILDGQWKNDGLADMLQKMLPEKISVDDFHMELQLKPHGKRILQINTREIFHQSKKGKLILCAIEDITERKLAIDQYQSTISDLKLSNEQLDQFVHVVSHDLQEPLRKILTFASRLEDSEEHNVPVNKHAYLNKIEQSSQRMSNLIQDLLLFSRLIDQRDLFEEVDLNEVIATTLQDLEIQLEQKKIELKIGDLPQLEAIPVQMGQLFHNLLSNAIKFSDINKSPWIEVRSRNVKKDRRKDFVPADADVPLAEIIIRDNGIGFHQKYAEQIFTIFQRLHTRSDFEGTGIGLAIVKKIIKNHHGHIFVESEKGKGSAFHVILPLKQKK